MKMDMQSRIRTSAQAGFTLIELIVVIVILGILAATALPRFANLGADARVASLQAVRGSLQSTAAMAHARYLIAPSATIVAEGQDINMNATSGYPTANANLAAAAGITTADYVIIAPGTAATATAPGTTANQIAIVPLSVGGTATAVNCFVSYTTPTAANTQPTISAAPDPDNC